MTFIEAWERFSFYGMRFCLVLYMVKDMMFSQQKASYVYGLYCGFAYFAPLICGYIVDAYIGQRKAITLGSWCRFFGLILLGTGDENLFIPSLALIVIATGLIRTGMNTLVGMMYDKNNNTMRDSGFNFFYIFANVGTFFSILACGYVGQKYGYKYAFSVAGFGIMIGQIGYILTAKKTLGELGLKPVVKKVKEEANLLKGAILTRIEKIRLLAMFILFFVFVNAYDVCYEQEGNTIALFTDKFINRKVGDSIIPTPWFYAIGPIVIWIFTPLLGATWQRKAKMGKEVSYVRKFIVGLFLLGLSFVILAVASHFIEKQGTISMLWIIAMYFVQTLGNIHVFPVSYSLVAKLAPKRFMGLCYGIMSLEICVANFLSGLVGSLYSYVSKTHFFSIFAIITFCFATLLLSTRKKLNKMIEVKD